MASNEWIFDEQVHISKAFERLRKIIENESAVIVEHRHFRGARSPERLIFDDYERLEKYIKSEAAKGDSFYIWNFEQCCFSENAVVVGKVPDEDGRVPIGGAY